jgi:deazaflavin-dependent oxidoreductase (nitroreductase family)
MMSTSNEVNARNRTVIDEFWANDGRIGGLFCGAPVLLLHTLGARSGRERVNPLLYQELGSGAFAVFASKGGAPSHPDWYHNLVADPQVTAEIGTEIRSFRARTASGAERDRIWARQKIAIPSIDDIQAKTDRTIPVVVLEES